MKLSLPADQFLLKAANDKRLLPSHISLFMAIFYFSSGDGAGNFFKITRRKLMRFSRIKSIATYHKCIRELVDYGYIIYQPSYDPYRASMVSIISQQRTNEHPR